METSEGTGGSEIDVASPALMLPADAGSEAVAERLLDQAL